MRRTVTMTCTLLCLSVPTFAFAQDAPTEPLLGAAPDIGDGKLVGALATLAGRAPLQLPPGPLTLPGDTDPLLDIRNDLVVVDAVAVEGAAAALERELVALGLKGSERRELIISGRLPVSALEAVAALPELRFIRPSYAMTRTGSVSGQGDPALRGPAARATFGVDGSGITIGTMSDSYDCLGGAAGGVASGDLPNGIVALDDSLCPNTDEGRGMMELIADVAPGSSQLFHTAFGGQADFANGILELAAAGADIVVDDVFNFGEPFFQDGIIAQAVDQVVSQGVPYFSAAGNSADNSYEASFRSSGTSVLFNGGDAHDFDPGAGVDVFQRVLVPPGGSTLVLQWDDPFASLGGSGTDGDVVIGLTNTAGTSVFVASNPAALGGDPLRVFQIQNSGTNTVAANLVIEKRVGSPPGRLKYIIFQGFSVQEYDTASSTVVGHSNAAGALATGAAFYGDTPAFGTSPPRVENFSSLGGTPILFNTNGNPVNVTRDNPDFVAPDGTNTTFFGGNDVESDGFPNFFGTSAAAPHAAAAAALLLEKEPGLSPSDIESRLESTAINMGPAGFDLLTGHGLIDIEAALAAGASPPAITTPTPGSTLAGATETFAWSANGTAVDDWWLYVGSTQGSTNYANTGNIGSATSRTISGLPTNGSTVWVRLWYRQSGSAWTSVDTSFTAASGGTPAIVSPTPGSTLAGATQTFSWSANGAAANQWWLYAGSSVGARNYADTGNIGNVTSRSLSGLPTNGSTVWIRLWYRQSGGTWKSVDTSFTAASGGTPTIVSPTSGSTLAGATQTFSWSANGASANQWWLYAGSSVGARNYADTGNIGNVTSRSLSGLPTNGSTVWIRLWYRQSGGTWKSVDTSFTAASANTPAITSPSPGSTLAGATQTFSWSANGASANQWWLYAGSSVGARNYADTGNIGNVNSRSLSGLPTNGSTVWIRLWYRQSGGTWKFVDTSYTAKQ